MTAGIELVNGERFTAVEPTPLLTNCIDVAARGLESLLATRAPGTEVVARQPWDFGPDTQLLPSMVVVRTGQPRGLEVVIEFRTESTGRYLLGPKRMVYASARVPAFWVVDLYRRWVAVLEARADGEFNWPPLVRRGTDEIPIPGLGVSVPVGVLLDGWPSDRLSMVVADDEWFQL